MMLRSSSTPLLGSLIPSFHDTATELLLHTPSPIHGQIWNSRSGGSHSLQGALHSPCVAENHAACCGFRRVQSEGNLDQSTDVSYGGEEFTVCKKLAGKHGGRTLEAIPSIPSEEEEIQDALQIPTTSVLGERTEVKNEYDSSEGEGKMYLAMGLGAASFVKGGGNGGHRGGSYWRFSHDGQSNDLEEHYKRMLEDDPRNPLALQNYARFLYQVKGDLWRAEEYFSRAVLANPEDGDILSQYAKLTWELHHDQEKASRYFEKSVRASPEDSHVLAAYTNFLWNMNEEQTAHSGFRFHHGLQAATT